MLKAKKDSIVEHPVIKRLVEYKKTMKKLEDLDDQLEPEIDIILQVVVVVVVVTVESCRVYIELHLASL